jgi:hypothetical protein
MSDEDYTNSPLASALGIVLTEDQARSDAEKKRAIALTQTEEDKANSDASYARETVYSMIQKNNEAIDQLMEIARESMNPRAFEVLAGMIETNVNAADRLLKIHADKQKVQNNAINLERNKAAGNAALPGTTIINSNTNIAFVGSTTELLKMIKQEQSHIIDVDPVPPGLD